MGMGLSDYIDYVLALVFVLALIGLAAWLVRRFGGAAGMGGRRGGRIGVLEAAIVDKRRRLLLIRRDDVEHLVLIGGSQDLVIESGISAEAAGRRGEPDHAVRPAEATTRELLREPPPRPQPRPQQPAPRPPNAAAVRNAQQPAADRTPRPEPRPERDLRAERPARPEQERRPEVDIRPDREPLADREARPEPRPEPPLEREHRPERQARPAARRPQEAQQQQAPHAVRADGPRQVRPAPDRAPRPAPQAMAARPVELQPVEPPPSAEHIDELDDLLLEESPRQPRAVARAAGGMPDDI